MFWTTSQIFATGNSAYIQPTAYVYTKKSNSTDSLEPDKLEHDCPTTCVIKRQNPSTTFVSFYFHSPQKNSAHVYKMLLLHYFLKYFLDAIKKLWKATISFVTCLFIHQSSWNNLDPTGQMVMKFYIWVVFKILSQKFKFHSKLTTIIGTLYMKTNTHFWSYSHNLFLQWEMFLTKVAETIKTHIVCSITVFQKSCNLSDNVEKYCRARQATDDNMVHAHGMLYPQD